MNYRHAYHAGNICDVAKHAVFALLLEHMKAKEKGFAVLDTHAGCGLYDLGGVEAQQTNEAEGGAKKLWAVGQHRAEFAPYLSLLRSFNGGGELKKYAGSPALAARSLRPQDRLIACELHPEDARKLHRALGREERVQIHARDGYEALKAFLPFSEKRGLILIDPPFEKPDEFDRLIEAVKLIHARMKGAVLAVWYPIKERPTIWRFHEALAGAGIPKLLMAEFLFQPEVRADRLNGSGLVFMNPPWKLAEELPPLFAALHEVLETESRESVVKALTAL